MSAERTIRSLDALVQAFSDGSPIEVPLKQQDDETYVGRTYLRDLDGGLKEVLVRAKPIDKGHFTVSFAGISFDTVDASSTDRVSVPYDMLYLQYVYGRGLHIAGLTTTPLAGKTMPRQLGQELFGQPAAPALERDERDQRDKREQRETLLEEPAPTPPPIPLHTEPIEEMAGIERLVYHGEPKKEAIEKVVKVFGPSFSKRLLQSLISEGIVTGDDVLLQGGTHVVPYFAPDGSVRRFSKPYFTDTLEYRADAVNHAFMNLPPELVASDKDGTSTISALTALFLNVPQGRSEKPSLDELTRRALPAAGVLPDEVMEKVGYYLVKSGLTVKGMSGNVSGELVRALQFHFAKTMEHEKAKKELMRGLEYCDEDDIREQAVAAGHGAEAYQALRDLQQYAVLGMVPQDKVEDWIGHHQKQRGEQQRNVKPEDVGDTERRTKHADAAYTGAGAAHRAHSIDASVATSSPLASSPLTSSQPQHPPQYDSDRLVSEYWVLYRLGIPPGNSDKIIRARDMIFGEFQDTLQPVEVRSKIRYYRASQLDDAHFQYWNKENTQNLTAQGVLTDPNIRAWNSGQLVSQSDMSKLLGLPPASIKKLIDEAKVTPAIERPRLKQYTMKDVMPLLAEQGFLGWLDDGAVKLPPFVKVVPQEPSPSLGGSLSTEVSLDDVVSGTEENQQGRQQRQIAGQRAEPQIEEKRWYENGVLPIFTVDLSQQQGARSIGAIRELARAGEQAYVVSFKRTERQQDIVFLTPDNIDLFFKDTTTDDYKALLREITTGEFNHVVKQPFGVFTARTLEDHPGAYTAANDIHRALKTYQGYKLDTAAKAFIFVQEQEAGHFVASQRKRQADGSWETPEERTAMLQQTIREQYERFMTWKPTGVPRQRAPRSAALVHPRGEQEEPFAPDGKEYSAPEQPLQDRTDTSLATSPAHEEQQEPPTSPPAPTPQYRAMLAEYVFPFGGAKSRQHALTTVVEAYKDQYVQRVLADLANKQVINGESVRIGDSSFQLDSPVSIDDLARELHRSKQSIERKIALFPREAIVKKEGETLLPPVTALKMYHHLGEHPPKHPCNVGTVMGELLLNDTRDRAILDYLGNSNVVKAYTLSFEDFVVLHTELTRHLASVMASPEQRVRALKQIGYIAEEEYDHALQSAKASAASLAKLADATPLKPGGDGKRRVLELDGRVLTYQRGQPERVVDGNAIHYYQKAFNERYFRASTGKKDGAFYGTVVRRGGQQVGYEQPLPLDGLAKFLGASDGTVREHLTTVQRDFPRDLVSVTTSGPAVSPFTALFLLPPGNENGAKRRGEDVMAYLHLEEQVDEELLRFMRESSMMNDQKEMLATRFFSVWQQLGMNFAQLMSDEKRRELFMKSQGYIPKAEALKRLVPVAESGSTRYNILRDEMRGEHFVFGMVNVAALDKYIEVHRK